MLKNLNPASVEYYEAIRALSPEELAHEWQEITLDEYYRLLECLPPKRWKNQAFMVGECMTHHEKGAIYQAVTCVLVNNDAHYYTRPALLQSFNPETYAAEIRAQFSI